MQAPLQCDLATPPILKNGIFLISCTWAHLGIYLDQENLFQEILCNSWALDLRGIAVSFLTCWNLRQLCCDGDQEKSPHGERPSCHNESCNPPGLSPPLYEWAVAGPAEEPPGQLTNSWEMTTLDMITYSNTNNKLLRAGVVEIENWNRRSLTEMSIEHLLWAGTWNPLNNPMG